MSYRLREIAVTVLFLVPLLVSSTLAESVPVRIVLFGDSLISSYGLDSQSKFGVLMEEELRAEGLPVKVVDTGYTSTAFQGTKRLEELFHGEDLLGGSGPKAVILELGSNDCGRYKLEETQASLEIILQAMGDKHIPVLVVGTNSYDGCERAGKPSYRAAYIQMFADLASKHGDLYYRDFKDGLEGDPSLLQGDRDHPTAKGEVVVVAHMLPVVEDLVSRAKQP